MMKLAILMLLRIHMVGFNKITIVNQLNIYLIQKGIPLIFLYFSSDLVYVIIFPQLLLVVHFEENINARGSQLGFFMGMLVRISGGESKLKIPAIIKYPGYD